jgi:GPH family glycoside/pentoside/hexuronide:cation symporter
MPNDLWRRRRGGDVSGCAQANGHGSDPNSEIGALMANTATDWEKIPGIDTGAARPVTAIADRLSWPLIFGWSVGSVGPITLLYVINYALLYFLTDKVGMSAAIAAGLMFLSRTYDIVFDLVVGVLSDRTRSRWGRRRPWMFAGGIVSALGCMLVFNLPLSQTVLAGHATSNFAMIWVAGSLLLYFSGYSMFNVPYLAMPAEMTESYQDRTRLMSLRVFFVSVSGLLGIALAPALISRFGGGMEAYGKVAIIMGGLGLAAMLYCVAATRSARATHWERPKFGLAEQFRTALSNKPFLILIGVKLMLLLSMSSTTATMLFLVVHIMKRDPSALSIYGLVSNIGIFVSLPAWVWLGKRWNKQTLFSIAVAASAPVALSWLLASPAETNLIFGLRSFLYGLIAGGMLLMGQSLLPDTIEYDFRRTGLRREGIFSAIYSFVEKTAFALGPLIAGSLLAIFGYVPSGAHGAEVQSASAIHGIYAGVAIIPAIASVVGAILLLFYDLTEEKLRNTKPAAA